jgi:hypothetical protein
MPLGAPTEVQKCDDSSESGGREDDGRTLDAIVESLDPACGVLMDESLGNDMNLPAPQQLGDLLELHDVGTYTQAELAELFVGRPRSIER